MTDGHVRAWVLDDDSKGAVDKAVGRLADVDEGKVRAALQRLYRLLPDEDAAGRRAPRWRMEEVTMSLEISAEAGVVVAGVGATSSIEVVFRRVDAK
jgi:hypothetical protein